MVKKKINSKYLLFFLLFILFFNLFSQVHIWITGSEKKTVIFYLKTSMQPEVEGFCGTLL